MVVVVVGGGGGSGCVVARRCWRVAETSLPAPPSAHRLTVICYQVLAHAGTHLQQQCVLPALLRDIAAGMHVLLLLRTACCCCVLLTHTHAVTHLQQQRHGRVHGGGGGLVAVGAAAGAQREQLLAALPACMWADRYVRAGGYGHSMEAGEWCCSTQVRAAKCSTEASGRNEVSP